MSDYKKAYSLIRQMHQLGKNRPSYEKEMELWDNLHELSQAAQNAAWETYKSSQIAFDSFKHHGWMQQRARDTFLQGKKYYDLYGEAKLGRSLQVIRKHKEIRRLNRWQLQVNQ